MALAVLVAGGAVVVVVVLVQLLNTLKALRSPLRRIPGPWYAPLTTMHLRYGFSTGEIWKVVERAHTKYGPIVRLGPRQIWIADKDALKDVLLRVDLPKVAMYSEISRDKHSPGLFGEIRPEPHRRLKKFLSPAFTVNYIDGLEKYFQKTVGDLLQKYEDRIRVDPLAAKENGIEVDLMDDLHNVALDIMGECSFGKGFGQTNPVTSETEEGVDERVWKDIPRSIFDGLSKRYQTVYIKKFLRKLGLDINFDWPAEMITAIDAAIGLHAVWLQHLIDEGRKPDSGKPMSTRDIVDQMAEILLAGSETTSGTIACLFLELARNPAVRAKLLASMDPKTLRDEVVCSKAIRGGKQGPPAQYEYLEACIKENLRLHPIASEMGRRTGSQWVTLMGYNLPPHTVVSASYRDLHRNEKYWPQPLRFWPERWLSEEKRCGAPAADMDAYYPFSAGKHSCIGINFAWAEMRIVAAAIFSRFDVIEVQGQEIDFCQYITMQFLTGHWRVVLKPRENPIELLVDGVPEMSEKKESLVDL
ncbi:cytochrome P450 3A9 [Magnaporthiopsis poae ATCC 64411]|uniref:Cytochrome P450 3A9 n=1 Tax=Magnaporthiopsis poae (strain ATCC 64411 / 73-15) TaxID=644358 RepID=A0A0C4E8H6_MAGP6|nr:cytochrome P450 3A9 [Magnaporthiopsis poae ATCC 64411]